MRATFRDPALQSRLDRDGYARVPLLAADEVDELRAAYADLGPCPGDPELACHSSFHSYDAEYKRKVDAAIRAVLDPHLERVLDRQRALPSNFIVKWPAATSGFGLHQDLSLVDERHHRSVEVWVALDATTARNGQLWMVPGSHRWLPGHIRGIHGFSFPFGQVAKRIITRHAVPVPLIPGEAVVFNHATLHFSFPNRSDEPRRVAIADVVPEEADHLHYFGDGPGTGTAGVYAIDDHFWTDNNPFTLGRPPREAQRVGTVPCSTVSVDDDQLDRLVSAGLALDSERGARGAINAAAAWCHRCGAACDGNTDRLVGNVTLLCGSCREVEDERSGRDPVVPAAAGR